MLFENNFDVAGSNIKRLRIYILLPVNVNIFQLIILPRGYFSYDGTVPRDRFVGSKLCRHTTSFGEIIVCREGNIDRTVLGSHAGGRTSSADSRECKGFTRHRRPLSG